VLALLIEGADERQVTRPDRARAAAAAKILKALVTDIAVVRCPKILAPETILPLS
jgi:hypothetical protein